MTIRRRQMQAAVRTRANSEAKPNVPEGNCTYELVVVSYRSGRPLSRLLDAVEGTSVVVVDNGAGVDGVPDLAAQHDGVRYLDAGGNVGFAAAANLGAAASNADILIFVNPDCLPPLAVLAELTRTLCQQPDVAACSPALRGADGRYAPTGGGWAPTLSRCLLHAIGGHRFLRRAGVWVTPRHAEVFEVGWLAGTCLAVRRSTFLSVGGFDEHYFLYNEDMALGDRFRHRGMRQIMRGDLVVEHVGGGSSAVPPVGMWLLRAGSLGRYIDDHNSAAAALGMRAALCAGSVLRAVAFLVIGKRRNRCREMLIYASGVLRPDRATAIAMALLSPSNLHRQEARG
jgi:N-acetylglucosaminyl-diphospho-decaprenol L-rhamnosyltransferase